MSERDPLIECRAKLNTAMAALLEVKKSTQWLRAWTIADQAIKKIEGEK